MVRLCPCEVLFQFYLVTVMLYALLLDHFIHRSHRNTAINVACATVGAVTDDLRLR